MGAYEAMSIKNFPFLVERLGGKKSEKFCKVLTVPSSLTSRSAATL